jgi:hypothetical protein
MLLNHKKCDTTKVENYEYRPINLLSHLYKIFTGIINHRIGKKLDFYQSIEQGFRIRIRNK